MASDRIYIRLDDAATKLDGAAAGLGQGILGLDESRSNCERLADRYEDFAGRLGDSYPSLAGPAGRLSELFRELDAALGRLSNHTEELVVCADRMVADVRAARSKFA